MPNQEPKLGRYILDINGNPIECEDSKKWAYWIESADRHLGDDTVRGYRISTIFLGLDHNFSGKGSPILWETMVFSKRTGKSVTANIHRRFALKSEALEYHKKLVANIKLWGVKHLPDEL